MQRTQSLFATTLATLLAAGCAAPPVEVDQVDGALVFHERGRELARLWTSPTTPPEGVGPLYARDGYLHPVRTPSGRIVTGDYPPSHTHQHGVFMAWTRTTFEGRGVDFWNQGAGKGRVDCQAVDRLAADSEGARARLSLHHVDLSAPDGPRTALEEIWEVEVCASEDATLIDIVSRQRAAGSEALRVERYHYGGFAWRGPLEWDDAAPRFLTSEGLGRDEGNTSRARWCAVSGPVEGGTATLAILSHRTNFRAPQPLRLHPRRAYFCFAPGQLGPFTIERDTPLLSRYRVVAMDGEADPARIERLWEEWHAPPESPEDFSSREDGWPIDPPCPPTSPVSPVSPSLRPSSSGR